LRRWIAMLEDGARLAVLSIMRFAVLAWHRHRSRNALSYLDETRLRDIGLTPDEARAESFKPFWR
jgi:uncharacterized protein YjiS (DUF1127 family)